jgi:hypothetical protein
MKALLKWQSIVLLVGSLAVPAATHAEENPAPQSAGKYLHVLAGLAIGLATAATVESFQAPQDIGKSPLLLPALAVAGSAVAGTAKEILDSTGFGDPRLADVFITMSGGFLAAGAVAYAQSVFPGTDQGKQNGVTALFASAALLAVPVVIGFIKEIDRAIERRKSSPRTE